MRRKWVASRASDICHIVRSRVFAPARPGDALANHAARLGFPCPALVQVLCGLTPFLTGDAHQRDRGAFASFHRALHARWDEARLKTLVAAAIDALPVDTPVDLHDGLSCALVTEITADALGLPRDVTTLLQAACFTAWATAFQLHRKSVLAAIEPRCVDAIDILTHHPRRPQRIVFAGSAHQAFPHEEVFFLTSGLTTSALVSSALVILSQSRALQEALRAKPRSIPAFVAETLRLAPSVPMLVRTAEAPIAVGGQSIAAGETVLCDVARAGRDPSVFADPDMVDLDRRDPRPLGFGTGAHACIGAPFARRLAACLVR